MQEITILYVPDIHIGPTLRNYRIRRSRKLIRVIFVKIARILAILNANCIVVVKVG